MAIEIVNSSKGSIERLLKHDPHEEAYPCCSCGPKAASYITALEDVVTILQRHRSGDFHWELCEEDHSYCMIMRRVAKALE